MTNKKQVIQIPNTNLDGGIRVNSVGATNSDVCDRWVAAADSDLGCNVDSRRMVVVSTEGEVFQVVGSSESNLVATGSVLETNAVAGVDPGIIKLTPVAGTDQNIVVSLYNNARVGSGGKQR